MIRQTLIASMVFLSACVTPQPVDMAKVDPSDAKVNMEGLMTTWDKMVAANAKEAMDSVQRNRCSGVPGQCHPD